MIFLYLKTAGVDLDSLHEMRNAGIIPVAVDSFDDVKLLETEVVSFQGMTDLVFDAAIATVKSSSSLTNFATRICAGVQARRASDEAADATGDD